MIDAYAIGKLHERQPSPAEWLDRAGESLQAGAALLLEQLVQLPENMGAMVTHISLRRPDPVDLGKSKPAEVKKKDQVEPDYIPPRGRDHNRATESGDPQVSHGRTSGPHNPA